MDVNKCIVFILFLTIVFNIYGCGSSDTSGEKSAMQESIQYISKQNKNYIISLLSVKYGINKKFILEVIELKLKRQEEMIMDLVILSQTNEKELTGKDVKRNSRSDLGSKITKISSEHGFNEKKVASLLMDYIILRNLTN